MEGTRKSTSVRLPEQAMYPPNKDTLEALDEARSGKYAGVVDTSSFEAFMKSLDK